MAATALLCRSSVSHARHVRVCADGAVQKTVFSVRCAQVHYLQVDNPRVARFHFRKHLRLHPVAYGTAWAHRPSTTGNQQLNVKSSQLEASVRACARAVLRLARARVHHTPSHVLRGPETAEWRCSEHGLKQEQKDVAAGPRRGCTVTVTEGHWLERPVAAILVARKCHGSPPTGMRPDPAPLPAGWDRAFLVPNFALPATGSPLACGEARLGRRPRRMAPPDSAPSRGSTAAHADADGTVSPIPSPAAGAPRHRAARSCHGAVYN
jgi:hypothetical protein